jgi:hypothetical protein
MLVFVLLLTAKLFAQEHCLIDAEKALNAKKYALVISSADDCIENFWPQALALQRKLEAAHATVGIGNVPPEVKQSIFANGLLNDVATACFYEGLAAEKLMNTATSRTAKKNYKLKAVDAFGKAKLLSYGRHWDPSNGGFFWSPAEGAANHLSAMVAAH